MHIESNIQVFKKEKIHFFPKKYELFYPSIPEECDLHKIFQC